MMTARTTDTVDLAPELHPAWAQYEAVRDPAWAQYEAVHDPALAQYKAVRDPAWAQYKAVRDQAWAQYKAVRDPAWAQYEAVRDPAWAQYKAVRDQAWAQYEAVRDPALAQLAETNELFADIARDHPAETAKIVALLPATLGVLDAHADSSDWCETWVRLRDRALTEGVLVVVETAAAVTA